MIGAMTNPETPPPRSPGPRADEARCRHATGRSPASPPPASAGRPTREGLGPQPRPLTARPGAVRDWRRSRACTAARSGSASTTRRASWCSRSCPRTAPTSTPSRRSSRSAAPTRASLPPPARGTRRHATIRAPAPGDRPRRPPRARDRPHRTAPKINRPGWGGIGLDDATAPDWDAVEHAPIAELTDAIRPGGLANQKAPRIQAALRTIREQTGSHSLEFLGEMPALDARDWLTAIDGIGRKTASVVLLFSFGTPLMPVDRHVERVSHRIGLIPPKATADDAHELYLAMLEPDQMYEAHVNLIQHGRRTCHARKPACDAVPGRAALPVHRPPRPLTAGPSHGETPVTTLAQLVDEFLETEFAHSPTLASRLGLTDYDDKLDDLSADAFELRDSDAAAYLAPLQRARRTRT